jgi:hypothetical protein
VSLCFSVAALTVHVNGGAQGQMYLISPFQSETKQACFQVSAVITVQEPCMMLFIPTWY